MRRRFLISFKRFLKIIREREKEVTLLFVGFWQLCQSSQSVWRQSHQEQRKWSNHSQIIWMSKFNKGHANFCSCSIKSGMMIAMEFLNLFQLRVIGKVKFYSMDRLIDLISMMIKRMEKILYPNRLLLRLSKLNRLLRFNLLLLLQEIW